MPPDLTPEDKFCLLLARRRFSPGVTTRAIDQVAAGIRWDALFERAATHGLVPLLYQRLREVDFRGVPEAFRRKLADVFGINAIRNVLLTEELVSVLGRLGGAGIPVMPLKGVGLAESVYGDPALRICADLDILVQPKALAQCLDLLRSDGYTDRFAEPSLVRLLARYGKDCLLIREEGRTVYPLQVHCGLVWGGPAERQVLDEVWSCASVHPFHAVPAYAMSPEWEFLYLAVHAARHGMFPFKWLVDIDWLLARGDVNWQKVKEMAVRIGWQRPVQSCLAACTGLLESPVPEPFAGTLPWTAPKIRASAPGFLQIPRETLFSLRLLPTFSQRLQYLAIRLFVPTPGDCEFLPLPSSCFFLYYFLRPWRLGCAVAGGFIREVVARLKPGGAVARASCL